MAESDYLTPYSWYRACHNVKRCRGRGSTVSRQPWRRLEGYHVSSLKYPERAISTPGHDRKSLLQKPSPAGQRQIYSQVSNPPSPLSSQVTVLYPRSKRMGDDINGCGIRGNAVTNGRPCLQGIQDVKGCLTGLGLTHLGADCAGRQREPARTVAQSRRVTALGKPLHAQTD
jgi:hypothetical protein